MSRPLRVAHFLPNLAVGGRERVANSLCASAARHGITPFLIGYEPLAPQTATLPPAAPYWQLDRTGSDFAGSLRDLVARQQIDVLHAQGHIPACHAAQAFKGWRAAPPCIATMHVGLQGTRRWLWPIRRSLRAMDRLTAVSQDMAGSYALVSGREVEVVANGIDTGLHAGAMPLWPVDGQPFRFGMLSRLDAIKGHAVAIAAADLLIDAGHKLELHVAGEGERGLALARLAQDRPWLKLMGPVAKPEAFLRQCHGFILPSRAEGMPLALMEAMAAGLACVVSDLPSLRTMAGSAVHYAPAGVHKEFATVMRHLMLDKTATTRLSAAAGRAAEKFSLATMAAIYARHYRTIGEQRWPTAA